MNMCVCWGGEGGRPGLPGPQPPPRAGPGNPSRPPSPPPGSPRPPASGFPASLSSLGLRGKAGFRGEGLGGDTEPSLLHPPPRSALPPSPPPPSAFGRPRGRKKGAKEAEVRTRRPEIRAQAPGPEVGEASACGPNSADQACGEPQAGPRGRSAPPWGPRALHPSSLGEGRRPGPGPQLPPPWSIPGAEPPPLLSLVLGAQPPPSILSAAGTQESIPLRHRRGSQPPPRPAPPLPAPGGRPPSLLSSQESGPALLPLASPRPWSGHPPSISGASQCRVPPPPLGHHRLVPSPSLKAPAGPGEAALGSLSPPRPRLCLAVSPHSHPAVAL